jgi:formiminotetrahydrofolate cyclodeaminase
MIETQTFLKVLDPDDTSTGGGSASAIAGAMAAALFAMVCQLSAHKAAGTDDTTLSAIGERSRELSEQLLQGGQADRQAFQGIRKAYKLARETEAEQSVRSQAIQSAFIRAAQVPMDNATLCLELLRFASDLAQRIKPQVRSDFKCGVQLARAGCLGCLENVAINLRSIEDQSVVAQLQAQSRDLQSELSSLAGYASFPFPWSISES